MKLNLLEPKEILDFEKEIGYELVVTERAIKHESNKRLSRYYVKFEYSDVIEGAFLIGIYGNGNTIDEALKDYCKLISNCLVAFNAYSLDRKEIKFPKLTHTKLLNK